MTQHNVWRAQQVFTVQQVDLLTLITLFQLHYSNPPVVHTQLHTNVLLVMCAQVHHLPVNKHLVYKIGPVLRELML